MNLLRVYTQNIHKSTLHEYVLKTPLTAFTENTFLESRFAQLLELFKIYVPSRTSKGDMYLDKTCAIRVSLMPLRIEIILEFCEATVDVNFCKMTLFSPNKVSMSINRGAV